jgi:hypothetical protein
MLLRAAARRASSTAPMMISLLIPFSRSKYSKIATKSLFMFPSPLDTALSFFCPNIRIRTFGFLNDRGQNGGVEKTPHFASDSYFSQIVRMVKKTLKAESS